MRYFKMLLLMAALALCGCGGDDGGTVAPPPPDNQNPPVMSGTFHHDAAGAMWIVVLSPNEDVIIQSTVTWIRDGGSPYNGWVQVNTSADGLSLEDKVIVSPGETEVLTIKYPNPWNYHEWKCTLRVYRPGQSKRFDVKLK